MNLPTPEELQQAWEDLRRIHAQHLASHGVKIPKVEQYSKQGRSIQLAVLYYYKDKGANKNLISQVCQRDAPHLAADQQIRHLKRLGWHLTTPRRGHHCLNPYNVSPEFETDKIRSEGMISAKEFEDVKDVYGRKCATCGAKEGQSNPRYGEDLVELQRGHRDPAKPPEIGNIIPQCQFCNRAYRRDYVFDEKGRVSAIADVRPVRNASEAVQKKVWEWLKDKFSVL